MNYIKYITLFLTIFSIFGCGGGTNSNEIVKTYKSEFNSKENSLISELENKKFYSYLSDSKYITLKIVPNCNNNDCQYSADINNSISIKNYKLGILDDTIYIYYPDTKKFTVTKVDTNLYEFINKVEQCANSFSTDINKSYENRYNSDLGSCQEW